MSVSFLMELIEEREQLMARIKSDRLNGNSENYKNWVKALKDITYVIDSERDQLDDYE